ncbi:MAG: hypothetical protein JWR84_3003 [Caulobacter sp.]|nr:hypothetical protein [Caulobacter sp.]
MSETALGNSPAPILSGVVRAVSWDAVLAGALTAIAASLILFSLASGLGFAVASPWSGARTLGAVGATVGVWLVIVQWLASGLGGYLTGRLRSRWIGTHEHEVFFRDTAHGFLAWATASVVVAAVAALVATAGAGKAADTAVRVVGPAYEYDADSLFRTSFNDPAATATARDEARRVLQASDPTKGPSAADRAYLAGSVVNRTGLKPEEATARVDDVVAREMKAAAVVQSAADDARKAAAAFAVLTALSLLIGAFIASVAAALGGQERDKHP